MNLKSSILSAGLLGIGISLYDSTLDAATLKYQWNFAGSAGTPLVTSGGGLLTTAGTANFTDAGSTGLTGDYSMSVTNAYTGGVGAGNRVTASGANVLTGLGTLNTFTVTMWVKTTTGDFTNFARIIQLGSNSNPEFTNPSFCASMNNGNVEFSVNGAKVTATVTGFNAAQSAGQWVFLAFTYDGTTTNPYYSGTHAGLYGTTGDTNAIIFRGTASQSVSPAAEIGLNTGAPSYSIAPGGMALGASATLNLGNRNEGGRGFTGNIDDVRIYDGPLTLAQLNAVRLQGTPPPPSGGPDYFWKGDAGNQWTGSNWTSDVAGTTPASPPNDGTISLSFAATSPLNMDSTVMATNWSISALKFNLQSTLGTVPPLLEITGTHNLTIGNAGILLSSDSGQAKISTTGQVILGAAQTWTNNSASPFEVASTLSGSPALITAGTGVTVLSGVNTLSGGITVDTGTLRLGNASGFGGSTGTVSTNSGSIVDLNGLNLTLAALTGAGQVRNNAVGTSALTIANSAADTFSGQINNGADATRIVSLTKTGTGTLSLNGYSNFTGNVTISEGMVTAGASVGGAPFSTSLGNCQTSGRTITLPSGATLRLSTNNVFGNQAGNFSLLPQITLDQGTLDATRYNVIGNITLNAATLTHSTTEAGPNYFGYQFKGAVLATGTSAITSTNGKGNHLALNTPFTVDTAATLTISAPLRNQSGDFANAAGGFTKLGAGELVLNAVNTYTGETNLQVGSLQLTNPGTLSNIAALRVTTGATLNLNFGGYEQIGDLVLDSSSVGFGTIGATGSGANHEFAWITGSGLLYVQPAAYTAWISTFYPTPGDANAAMTADPDHDGKTNLQEFAFDTAANSGADSNKSRVRVETVGAEQALVFTLAVRDGAVFTGTNPCEATVADDDVTYTIEGSNQLMDFDQPVSEVTPAHSSGLDALDSGWSYRTFRLNGAVGGLTPRGPSGFLRAGITLTR